jgi:hypothetical protein
MPYPIQSYLRQPGAQALTIQNWKQRGEQPKKQADGDHVMLR